MFTSSDGLESDERNLHTSQGPYRVEAAVRDIESGAKPSH